MNCNTTHYRANSSSVPGDPTVPGAAGAFKLAPDAELPESWTGALPKAEPLELERPRPDAERVTGLDAAVVVVSRTDYPGWRYWVNDAPGSALRAFGSFPAFAVPAGQWSVTARYQPASFAGGLAVTALFLTLACIYLYNRARRSVRAF